MGAHELILLSPYRYPGQSPLTLADEDMACWLNGFSALWHPAVLWQAKAPPRVEAAYDYEQPQAGQVFVLPESPPLFLPDDWEDRVKAAGAVSFKATTDRATTLENLKRAIGAAGLGWPQAFDLGEDKLGPFFGLGWGHLLEGTLAEAMEHENLLEADGFWDNVQQAVATLAGLPYTPATTSASYPPSEIPPPVEDFPTSEYQEFHDPSAYAGSPETSDIEEFTPPPGAEEASVEHADRESHEAGHWERTAEASGTEPSPVATEAAEPKADDGLTHLRTAAEKLLSAREVLYPVAIHLIDLYVLDERNLAQDWPASFNMGVPLNVLASGSMLERLARDFPDKLEELRNRLQVDEVEVCGGCYLEREDPLLPVDSQLWNLHKGLDVARDILGSDVRVFARKRFGFHPQLPLMLTSSGLTRALLLTFDENAGVPQYQAVVVGWPSPDGKQVDAFVRAPHPADSPNTFFNLGHYWFKTTREDQTATLAFLHTGGKTSGVWYRDLMHLARLAPVLGQWTTFSRFFNDTMAGEHTSALSADEFHSDFLSERTAAHLPDPVTGFARHVRLRRRLDACWTLAALHRGLAGSKDSLRVTDDINALEERVEAVFAEARTEAADTENAAILDKLGALEKKIAGTLAERLQARAAADQPGYLILNPCSFARRVALELEGASRPLALEGPVKACQLDGSKLRAVVEVPALGFAWIPREGPAGTALPPARMRLADQQTLTIRNEFFEVEVDPVTGGLKAIRDHKTRLNRLGQRLVFNPGSRMDAKSIQVTSSGPALAEIVAEGELRGEQNQVLATFRQRFRLWMGRPILELRVEITPAQPPAGYPWHAYFGSRFAWRDERAILMRGVNATGYLTAHNRPQSPDFLELRLARQGTVIFPGGLPFHQRQEGRMVDIILIPEGEQATAFDLCIGLDREVPMQTALGIVSPVAVVPTSKGPPHIGAAGWLFHCDVPNLLMSRMYPGKLERRGESAVTSSPDDSSLNAAQDGVPSAPAPEAKDDAGPDDAVTARLLECAGYSGHAEFRCVRNPKRAAILDARGGFLIDATPSGDAVFLEVSPNDLVQLQIEFS